MAVITISRELGSGGTEIAQLVTKNLSYKLIDKNHIEHILKQYGLFKFGELYDTPAGIWSRLDSDNIQLIQMLNKAIAAIARLDHVVILGRGGFAILRDYLNVLNVRIQAPFAYRAKNIMQIENITDPKIAAERVADNDHVRERFIQTFYNVECDSAGWFHVVIDTSRIPVNTAVQWIVDAAKQLPAPDQTGLTTQDIEVDPVMAKVIADLDV